MRPIIQEISSRQTPEMLAGRLVGQRGLVLLRSAGLAGVAARYSVVAVQPFLTFCSTGSRCEVITYASDFAAAERQEQFGNPWHLLDALMARYESLDEIELPFPLGGCFGYWGYELKNFTEPKLHRRAVPDLELPDCQVGFHASLVVFDHQSGQVCVVATGLGADGVRTEVRARAQLAFWTEHLAAPPEVVPRPPPARPRVSGVAVSPQVRLGLEEAGVVSNTARFEFLSAVARAQAYIRTGDIYQVNLSHRLTAPWRASGWELYQRLLAVSPAPFAAYLDCGEFQLASSSPEQFLRMSGAQIVTRPIKGTRPRAASAAADAQLAAELQSSAKERAELVMITDLLRNDLGRFCEYGSVRVPELAQLERFAQVQHLVSTVVGRLRPDVTHFAALASAFPGGSITGAPKFRAMEIIDELEPATRGPYCGCLGYLGFNRESQLNISIRTAICQGGRAHFNVGAGIVADSGPEAEYEETLAKAQGFLRAIHAGETAA